MISELIHLDSVARPRSDQFAADLTPRRSRARPRAHVKGAR
jgi:hypothetical protein